MHRPESSIQTSLQNWAIAGAVGLAYFLAACLSLRLSQGVGGLATIWPASGVFVSALLLAKPGQSAPLAYAVSFASFAANMLFGASIPMALGFTFANVAEGLLISQMVIRSSGVPRLLDDRRWLATFLGATVAGSAVGGAIATIVSGDIALAFFASWFMTASLGTLIVTPLIVTIVNGLRGRRRARPLRHALGRILLAITVAAISSLVLAYGEGRFLFLPVIGVIAATYFFGSRGAAVNISLIAIIAAVLTDYSGSQIGTVGLNADTLFLQLYLLSLLGAAWPLAALMAEKERLIDQYAETNAYLKLAESTAKVGHWYFGPDNTSLVWSEEVYRIHGVEPADLAFDSSMDLEESSSLNLYHPDDRGRVRDALLAAMGRHEGFAYQARIVRPDGAIRHVSSVGHPRYAASGAFEGLFGTFQDITDQTEILAALQIARAEALSEASTSQWLAETDDLTGIANRRKILANLRAAVLSAKSAKKPVTIAIFDIDHFKAVNDQHGHHAGDEVLKRVAKLAVGQLRPADSVGRLGGEEFLVVLPGANGANGFKIIERLRQRIETETWLKIGPSKVTISAGIATLTENDDVEQALRRADGALYKAKNAGRNLLRTAA